MGSPYSYTFQAKDGVPPSKFTFSSGVLPPGLSIDTSGTMSGTPTTAGTYSFYVAGVDSVGNASQVQFTITIQTKLTVTVGFSARPLRSGRPTRTD